MLLMMHLCFVALFLLLAASEVFHITALLWVGIGLFLVVIVGGLIFLNTGGRIDR